MEMEGLDLNLIPVRALKSSSRLLLGRFLNPEQRFLTADGHARDFRGLAEQMDFENNDIRNFARLEDPTSKILEAWEINPEANIGRLIEYLKKMDRHDAINDLQSRFEEDANAYLQRSEAVRERPSTVSEGTSHVPQQSYANEHNVLTCDDSYNGDFTFYDAYVSYADEDIPFVNELAMYLEQHGFKLYLRTRDELVGHFEYDAMMRIIKERCRRVLIILSPDYVSSPYCEVQASFAASLGFAERFRKIIPVVWKPCTIPLTLQFISKIDFTKSERQDWIWDRLKNSLLDNSSSVFTSPERRITQGCSPLHQIDYNGSNSGNPAITFPSSSCSVNTEAHFRNVSEVVVAASETLTSSPISVSKSSPPTKLKKLQNLFRQTKKVVKKQVVSPNFSSSSNATSGFHSQSGNVFESIENSNTPCSQDTPV